MKGVFTILTMFVFILIGFLRPVTQASDLEISGFFDVTGSYQDRSADRTAFSLGQAEIDLTREFSDKVGVEVAIAYHNETATFELGAAIVDIHLFGSKGTSHRRFRRLDHSGIIAGQFDVPFGIDYQVYPSLDRKLVTSPMAVELTHAGWNDFGVQLYMSSNYGNLVIFGVNGFESSYEISDQAHSLSLGLAIGETVNTTPANAFGGRLGVLPLENLEIGASGAVGLNKSDNSEMILLGGDVQYSIADFALKGEYVHHSLNRSIDEEKNQGYYIQTMYSFDQLFVVGRYGAFEPDNSNWHDRWTAGIGYVITEGVEMRFESTINKNSANNTNILQLAAAF